MVGNPPYGERLGEKKAVEAMYKDMGKAFAELDTWSVYMLTSNERLKSATGKSNEKRKLFNGLLRRTITSIGGKGRQNRTKKVKFKGCHVNGSLFLSIAGTAERRIEFAPARS
ncbi:hypothetical protein PO124_04315 [Bacillus licheniformis]|nr:hypothetical protein [Bacillus licheniformis]